MLRRINLSAAIIVLICFFLPWVQVSCGSGSDTLSGLGLARGEHPVLWLVPLLMLAVLAVGFWREQPKVAAIVCVISGTVTALLMNRERMRVHDSAGLIPTQLTGWFWLALFSSLIIVATAIGLVMRRRRPD